MIQLYAIPSIKNVIPQASPAANLNKRLHSGWGRFLQNDINDDLKLARSKTLPQSSFCHAGSILVDSTITAEFGILSVSTKIRPG